MTRTWKRALVTGASSGIGASFAKLLAASGTDLVLVARSAKRLEELGETLSKETGVTTEVLVADLSTPEGVASVSLRLRSTPPIDLLINNAGLGYVGDFVDVAAASHLEQITVNIDALVQLTHAACNAMDQSGGTILNVSSIAGDVAGPKSAVYNATKSFVTSFSQSVYTEMKDRRVTVTCLCPGLTRTEFQDRAGYDASTIPQVLWQDADAVAATGLEAAAAGKPVVVSGAVNKFWSRLMRSVPRSVSRAAADRLNRK